MKIDLTQEEIQIILESVAEAREAYNDLAIRTEGDGAAQQHDIAVEKVEQCNNILRTLEQNGV